MERIYLDRDWLYSIDNGDKKEVCLPHTNIEIPYNYFDEKIYQFVSTYERNLFIDEKYRNKHLFLTFDGVAHVSDVYINDKLVCHHACGYDSFNVDIKDYVEYGKDNKLKVIVDSKEDNNIPPFGRVIDYLTYGGIYRDVYLDIRDLTYIKDVFVKPTLNSVDVEIELSLPSECIIYLNDKEVLRKQFKPKDEFHLDIDNPILWELDNPYLYNLKIETETDELAVRFGLRTCVFKTDGFYLNNKKIKLLGLNRHQSYPYVGYAMPKSMQVEDVRILKEELGVNAVRTSHYMQSQYFLDACDELGLLVFTETPGWQFVGDLSWQSQAKENIRQMVLQNRNHPSIILWGARINESQDYHDFYTDTNNIIHSLDSTRQTGGVRYLMKSEELEDVYTYNDFSSDNEDRILVHKKQVVTNPNIPYLVSEFNGHMYPTKTFDREDIREKHMLRYAEIFDVFFGDKEITGIFGWCMFDYNTHKDFGSGDKICYHGVLDMFRNPKLPARLYHTVNLNDNSLFVSSNFKPGDHPSSALQSLYVLTDAEKIRFYRNDELIREFDHHDSPFKNIPHAPILVDDFVGDLLIKNEGYSKKVSDKMKAVLGATLKYGSKLPLKYKLKYLNLMLFHKINYAKGYELYGKYIGNWGSKQTVYRFDAVKGGEVVNSISLTDSINPVLKFSVSSNELHIDHTYDVASIRIEAVSDNVHLPYYSDAYQMEVSHNLEIIGPKLLVFRGGFAGTYIKTKDIGEGYLRIFNDTSEYKLKFNVTKDN